MGCGQTKQVAPLGPTATHRKIQVTNMLMDNDAPDYTAARTKCFSDNAKPLRVLIVDTDERACKQIEKWVQGSALNVGGNNPTPKKKKKKDRPGTAPVGFLAQQAALQPKPVQVVTCTTVPQAVTVLNQSPDAFDLVVAELSLPHMSGFKVLQSVKRVEEKMGYSPVLLYTGNIKADAVKEAIKRGAADVVSKPLVKSLFVQRIESICACRLMALQQHVQLREIERLEGLVTQWYRQAKAASRSPSPAPSPRGK